MIAWCAARWVTRGWGDPHGAIFLLQGRAGNLSPPQRLRLPLPLQLPSLPPMMSGVPMGPHGSPWGRHGFPWVPMGYPSPWGSMGPHGNPWDPMGLAGQPAGSAGWPASGRPQKSHFSKTRFCLPPEMSRKREIISVLFFMQKLIV